MRRVLIVVYSWTGTSHRLAQAMASSLQWSLAEVRDAKPGRTPWRCIADSLLRRRPAIRYDGLDPRGFDAVVLVSPIWNGRLAGPMRSFVAERAQSLPPVAVVAVMGGRCAPGALAEIRRLLPRPPILDAAFTQREVEADELGSRLQAFGLGLDAALGGTPSALRPALASAT